MQKLWAWVKKYWTYIVTFIGGIGTMLVARELVDERLSAPESDVERFRSDIAKLRAALKRVESNNTELVIRNQHTIGSLTEAGRDVEQLKANNAELSRRNLDIQEQLTSAEHDIERLEASNKNLAGDLVKFREIRDRLSNYLKTHKPVGQGEGDL